MADSKDTSIGRILMKGLVGFGLVAVPAFGGQLVSALGKSWSPVQKAAKAGGGFTEFLVDGAAGGLVAGAEVGVAAMFGGKKAAAVVAPLAIGGALLGAAVPPLDRVVDGLASSLLGLKPTETAAAPAAPSNVKALPPRTTARVGYGFGGGMSIGAPGGGDFDERIPGGPVMVAHGVLR